MTAVATAPIKEKRYTLEEYLNLEETSEVKHEFHNGKRIEMPGGKLNHNAISMNIGFVLIQAIDTAQKNCLVLSSDMKIYIPAANRGVYPDTAVLCETPQFYNNRQDMLLNPLLIVEVLSESTEGYDRGEKFNYYSTLPSFREYVLVSQDKPQIEVLYLQNPAENLWKHARAEGLEAEVQLYSLDCKIALKEVYKRVVFEQVEVSTISE
jgi:Uma2 family endonuclease